MLATKQSFRSIFPLLVLAFLFSACQEGGPTAVPSQMPAGTLVLYSSPTPSQTRKPPALERLAATLPITPPPAATPFAHVIAKGDTMGSIALKYGVGLQDLLAANPKIDPHFMTIGQTVNIPIKVNGLDPGALPTLTPVPVQQAMPDCYSTSDGGAWCFYRVKNDQAQALENLSAWIGLFNPSGELLFSQTALAPLNLLSPGMSLPLAAYFPPPVPGGFTVRAELLTAIPVAKGDPRYLQARVELDETIVSQDGKQATVKGSVVQPAGKPPAKVVWLAVVAYDVDGDVVGMRRWELDRQSFEATVFSLGPAIDRVDVLIEARS